MTRRKPRPTYRDVDLVRLNRVLNQIEATTTVLAAIVMKLDEDIAKFQAPFERERQDLPMHDQIHSELTPEERATTKRHIDKFVSKHRGALNQLSKE